MLPDTLPLITVMFHHLFEDYFLTRVKDGTHLDKPYPAIKLSPNNNTLDNAFMHTRHSMIILIIKLLFMSLLLKLKNINLKYQTGKELIKVLQGIDLTAKKKDTMFNWT